MWWAEATRRMLFWTCFCTDRWKCRRHRCGAWWKEEEGQATIEAALLLPVVMMCIALLVQPGCILYTRAVMEAAAAEACRLVATTPSTVGTSVRAYEAYVLRRLRAVPAVDIFHCGGHEGWNVLMDGSTSSHQASVIIETKVRPLPLLGVLPALLGSLDGDGRLTLRTEVVTTTRPGWLEGGYSEWSTIWE